MRLGDGRGFANQGRALERRGTPVFQQGEDSGASRGSGGARFRRLLDLDGVLLERAGIRATRRLRGAANPGCSGLEFRSDRYIPLDLPPHDVAPGEMRVDPGMYLEGVAAELIDEEGSLPFVVPARAHPVLRRNPSRRGVDAHQGGQNVMPVRVNARADADDVADNSLGRVLPAVDARANILDDHP